MTHSPAARSKQSGFTLIELLVVIVISLLVAGGGISAYVNFNERQTISSAGRQVQGMMIEAAKKARVGDYPTTCVGKLTGYSVSMNSNINTVSVNADCSNRVNSQLIPVDTYTLPNGLSFGQTSAITFATLQGAVTNAGTISLSSAHYTYSFTVDAGGSVSDPTITMH